MDNQNTISKNNFKKLLTRRNIFILLGVVIVLELVWALSSVWKNQPVTEILNIPKQSIVQTVIPTSISLESNKDQVEVGEVFTLRINLSSDKKSYGSDVVITYDPQYLTVQKTADEKSAVKISTLYDEVPFNTVDEKLGQVRVSAISNKEGGELAQGELGTVDFIAKKIGNTKIQLEFVEGSTSDTNILDSSTGEDILVNVKNLNITITP